MATVGAKYLRRSGEAAVVHQNVALFWRISVFSDSLILFWYLCIRGVNSKSIPSDLFGIHLTFVCCIAKQFRIAKKGLMKM